MEQGLTYKNIAVVGCGAAGGFVSVLLSKNPELNITAFDVKEPFSTLLPTGGGRCNLTYNEDDFKEFAKNYPRGEKFLLSVFSKFDQKKTRDLFADLGIKTYVQSDNRVFPVSNSSLDVIRRLRKHLQTSNFTFKKEKVISIMKNNNKFIVKTEKSDYEFDNVIITTGGKNSGHELASGLGHNIIKPVPSLTSLDIKEKNFYKLAGLCFKNAQIKTAKYKAEGDILFAHKFITGPLIFKISSLCAYEEISAQKPLEIILKLTNLCAGEIEETIKNNYKRTIKNVFSMFAPESFILEIMSLNQINPDKQAAQLKKAEKEILINALTALKLHVQGRIKNSEIVTAGGVDLKEVNPKTMESKTVKGLFFAGEILDIDGFTGGFNLQNCWSGAYIISLNFI